MVDCLADKIRMKNGGWQLQAKTCQISQAYSGFGRILGFRDERFVRINGKVGRTDRFPLTVKNVTDGTPGRIRHLGVISFPEVLGRL